MAPVFDDEEAAVTGEEEDEGAEEEDVDEVEDEVVPEDELKLEDVVESGDEIGLEDEVVVLEGTAGIEEEVWELDAEEVVVEPLGDEVEDVEEVDVVVVLVVLGVDTATLFDGDSRLSELSMARHCYETVTHSSQSKFNHCPSVPVCFTMRVWVAVASNCASEQSSTPKFQTVVDSE